MELAGLAPLGVTLEERRPLPPRARRASEAIANLVEPAERALVSPVEVLEQHDDGRLAGEVGEVVG